MFVWVLRDKGSEWRTIRNVAQRGELPFLPLVEAVCEPFLPRAGAVAKDPVKYVQDLAGRLSLLANSGRVWIDLSNLLRVFSAHDVGRLIGELCQHLEAAGAIVTPVVRTSSPQPVVDNALSWARNGDCGLCIRVDGVTHLDEKSRTVRTLASASALRADQIDLIVDGARPATSGVSLTARGAISVESDGSVLGRCRRNVPAINHVHEDR